MVDILATEFASFVVFRILPPPPPHRFVNTLLWNRSKGGGGACTDACNSSHWQTNPESDSKVANLSAKRQAPEL